MKEREYIRTEWFKDHIAKVTTAPDSPLGPTTWVEWRKPGTWNYGVVYCITGHFLAAMGDLGDSIYQWPQSISLEFLAGCDLDYFESKCQASEHGRDHKERDERVAATRLREILLQQFIDEDAAFGLFVKEFDWKAHPDSDPDEEWEKFSDEQKLPWKIKALAKRAADVEVERVEYSRFRFALSRCETVDDLDRLIKDTVGNNGQWSEWIRENPLRIEDVWEYGEIGMVCSSRCEAHLVGLKMAWEQVRGAASDSAKS